MKGGEAMKLDDLPSYVRELVKPRMAGVPVVLVGDDGAWVPKLGGQLLTMSEYHMRYDAVPHKAVKVTGLTLLGEQAGCPILSESVREGQ